jgi:fido (protein-threonine AMPylation protein)
VARTEAELFKVAFEHEALAEGFLLALHFHICGDLTPDWAGKWRTMDVTVGRMTPPPHWQVPLDMRNHFLDLQARWSHAEGIEATLELLAFAEGRFLSIHPFRDFNGRTVRLFLAELLRRLDLPPVDLAPESESERAAYFLALEAADQADLQPLIAIWRQRFSQAGVAGGAQ